MGTDHGSMGTDHGSMGTDHGSMGTDKGSDHGMDKIQELVDEQTTNAPSVTEQPKHHQMDTTYANEDFTYGHFDGHQKDSSDEECGCTCLTAEEKQRWLNTMDKYDQKLKQWEAQFEHQ